MKIFYKAICYFISSLVILLPVTTHADIFELWQQQSNTENNLNTQWPGQDTQWITNKKLEGFKNSDDIYVGQWWTQAIKKTLERVAKDLKDVIFFIASLYFFILVLKLLMSEKTEDEVSNFKKWWLWITIWLVVTQVAYWFVRLFFDKWVSENLASRVSDKLIEPFISFLETWAWFFFIAIAVYSFYKLITAGGNEDAAKEWKMSIIYAIIWFIWVKLTKDIVFTTYGKIDCWVDSSDIFEANQPTDRADCLGDQNLDWFAETLVNVINWSNGFIGIIVVILVIYAGARILLSRWEEEWLSQAKNTLLYIFIGITVLVCNYLILTFFLIPESTI